MHSTTERRCTMSHEHEGILDYAEMAGLGHTDYGQDAAHDGDVVTVQGA
jgi:hypothetical protein